MKIISERRSTIDGNTLLSCIIEYRTRKFKISNCSFTKLYIWSGFSGWLFIDNGDLKHTTQENINQFLNIMEAYTDEEENN
jgi:hypothetical protein